MRQKMFMSVVAILFVLAFVVPLHGKPTTFRLSYNQAQFQWRTASWGCDMAWCTSYQNFATSSDFKLTGNVLHTSISYSPSVTDLVGASTVYVFDAGSGKWIQHEGTIQYTSPYSGLTVTEYWRGYLEFSTPSDATTDFVHGVGYQWGYVFLPESDSATVMASYPYAVWDSTVGAWLVGFSIYLWDPTTTTQSYTVAFPSPFIEPVPANNFNPLGL